VDWSSAALDFRLAEAVLEDRFGDAAALMKRIGRRGDYVTEHSYHSWPLFKEFRLQPEFRTAYENVYEVPFVERLQEAVSKAQLEVQEEQDASSDLTQSETVIEKTVAPTSSGTLDSPSPSQPSDEVPTKP